MTARAATDTRVYYCAVCGPCLQELIEDEETDEVFSATYHELDHDHFDDEDNPQ